MPPQNSTSKFTNVFRHMITAKCRSKSCSISLWIWPSSYKLHIPQPFTTICCTLCTGVKLILLLLRWLRTLKCSGFQNQKTKDWGLRGCRAFRIIAYLTHIMAEESHKVLLWQLWQTFCCRSYSGKKSFGKMLKFSSGPVYPDLDICSFKDLTCVLVTPPPFIIIH